MPKTPIMRKGAHRIVMMDSRVADKLVSSGRFSYAKEGVTLPKPKRTIKRPDAASRAGSVKVQEADQKEAETQTGPMTATRVAPARRAMTRSELEAMTKADLKSFGDSIGANVSSADSKDDIITKLHRYMRRDMRAER